MWNPKISRKDHFCIFVFGSAESIVHPLFLIFCFCAFDMLYTEYVYIYIYTHVICRILKYVDVDTYTAYLNLLWKHIYCLLYTIYIYIIGTYIYLGPSVYDLPITWITRNLGCVQLLQTFGVAHGSNLAGNLWFEIIIQLPSGK